MPQPRFFGIAQFKVSPCCGGPFYGIGANADVVRIEHCGHYPHVERPDEVLKAFFAFHEPGGVGAYLHRG